MNRSMLCPLPKFLFLCQRILFFTGKFFLKFDKFFLSHSARAVSWPRHSTKFRSGTSVLSATAHAVFSRAGRSGCDAPTCIVRQERRHKKRGPPNGEPPVGVFSPDSRANAALGGIGLVLCVLEQFAAGEEAAQLVAVLLQLLAAAFLAVEDGAHGDNLEIGHL